jgi:hypothetical protein
MIFQNPNELDPYFLLGQENSTIDHEKQLFLQATLHATLVSVLGIHEHLMGINPF